jgi:hypothetical protein
LLEAAKLQTADAFRRSTIEVYAQASPILEALPFETIQGNALKYNQESALPGIGFRGVNEAFTESTGVLNPVTEALMIAGGDLDVDKYIVETQGQSSRSTHENMKNKALAQTWALKFIKGDSATTPKEFDGLQIRLGGSQVITQSAGACSLALLDKTIDAVDAPTHLIMAQAMKRRLSAASRDTSVGGQINFVQDQMGRQVTMYNGLPILEADANGNASPALDFTEASSSTSIYCVSFRAGVLNGIQSGPPDVRDIGELDTKPVLRTRIEWYSAFALFHPRGAARYELITDVAVVA